MRTFTSGFLVVLAAGLLSGCAMTVDNAVRQHADVMPQIRMGDSIEKVVGLMDHIQHQLPSRARKLPDRFMKDDVEVYIYYARSGRQPDGLTTDDEFTPYIFHDGKLVAIGWATLGGPKTHGQATSDTYINVQQTVK
jgi:hypothetical protein